MNIRHLTLTSIVTVSGTKRERVWSWPLWLQTVQVGSFPLYLALFILPTGLRLNLPSLCLSARWGEQAPVLGPRSLHLPVGPLLELTQKETEAERPVGVAYRGTQVGEAFPGPGAALASPLFSEGILVGVRVIQGVFHCMAFHV